MQTFYDVLGNKHERPDDEPVNWRISVYGIAVNDRDEVLAVRAHATGLWELPGGGVEISEKIEDCLRREVHEESGYEVSAVIDQPKVRQEFFYRRSKKAFQHSLRFYYPIEIADTKQDPHVINPEEVTEVKWLPINDLQESEWKKTALAALKLFLD